MKNESIANSGLSWLANKRWGQVTREERYFCAELYCAIKEDVSKFVRFLDTTCEQIIDVNSNWQVEYEVCFYRDWLKFNQENRKVQAQIDIKLSKKRTFDLALFSDSQVILFEAKSHQSFSKEQAIEFKKDRIRFQRCTGVSKVHNAAIISSKYTPRDSTEEHFSLKPLLTWEKLAGHFNGKSEIFRRADCIYRN